MDVGRRSLAVRELSLHVVHLRCREAAQLAGIESKRSLLRELDAKIRQRTDRSAGSLVIHHLPQRITHGEKAGVSDQSAATLPMILVQLRDSRIVGTDE